MGFETMSQSSFVAGEVVFDVRLRLYITPAAPSPLALASAIPAPAAASVASVAAPAPAPVPAAASSTTAVCCHWKNKGRCDYKDKCKFLHPEHKRGVGPSVKSSRRLAGAQCSGRAPPSA